MSGQRPTLVTALALVSLTAGLYLLSTSALRIANPAAIAMTAGRSLLGDLVLSGPVANLLGAATFLINGIGLWTLRRWARILCLFLAAAGAALVIPQAAAALAGSSLWGILSASLQVILRVATVGYLTQEPVKLAFQTSPPFPGVR